MKSQLLIIRRAFTFSGISSALLAVIILFSFSCGNAGKNNTNHSAGPKELEPEAAIALSANIPFLSVNLNNYKYEGNPVLTRGEDGAWDSHGIERVVVLRLSEKDWRMWYANTGKNRAIGMATSEDGMHWEKYADNPVFTPTEDWEQDYMSPTSIVQVNGKFYLYYWAPSHVFPDPVTGELPALKMKYIALAVSGDGINWTRMGNVDGKNGAVLGPEPQGLNEGAALGGSGVDAAKVFYLPEEQSKPWKMIYTAFGLHGQWNGLAESDDGIEWTKISAPIAFHSGTYSRATSYHLNSGQTIRCPVRIGNIWAALSYELDSHDSAPLIGLNLGEWINLGRRTLYVNQEYEGRRLHPWAVEHDDEWYYLYYSTGRSGTGLIRIPKRNVFQPNIVWENQMMNDKEIFSRIFEPESPGVSLYIISEAGGLLQIHAKNPTTDEWYVMHSETINAGRLSRIGPDFFDTTYRLSFTSSGQKDKVSAWLVPSASGAGFQ